MEFKILELEEYEVYGIEGVFDINDVYNTEIPLFWQENMMNGKIKALTESVCCPSSVNAICGYREEGGKLAYIICVDKKETSKTDGYVTVKVPKATWAVFENEPHSPEETPIEMKKLIEKSFEELVKNAEYTIIDGYAQDKYYFTEDRKCFEQFLVRVK